MENTPDKLRRNLLVRIGVLPMAALVLGQRQAWAVTNRVDIKIDGEYRVIRANGIPDHNTGRFPNRHNPNSIREQSYFFRTPVHPRIRERSIFIEGIHFGIAANGVLFDPLTAEFWNRDRQSGWRYDAMSGKIDLGLDRNNAHVQPNGAYHYHGLPRGLIGRWTPEEHSALIGYAADGFPIYALYGFDVPNDPASPVRPMTSSYRLKKGPRPAGGPGGHYDGTFIQDFDYIDGAGDLDDANGRFTVTPDYPDGTYAYFLTNDFPFIPHRLRGAPDPSFRMRRPPGGMDGRRRPPQGPRRGDGPPPPRRH